MEKIEDEEKRREENNHDGFFSKCLKIAVK
jgi:hypothetical protein